MVGGGLVARCRVADGDRREAPSQRRQSEADRADVDPLCRWPSLVGARGATTSGLERLQVERERLRRRWQRLEPVARAERREVSPIMGVSAFRRRREVGRRQIAVNGARKVGQDRVDVVRRRRRLDPRSQSAISAISDDLEGVLTRFHALFFARNSPTLACLRRGSSQARDTKVLSQIA